MSKHHNTITCTHGKGLAWPVCYDQTQRLDNLSWLHAESQHDLSQCGNACNCMECRAATIEYSEMVNPSKSSCIALRASELYINTIDHLTINTLESSDLNGILVRVSGPIEFQSLPGIIWFHKLENGVEFWLAQAFAYGSPHNAVYVNDHHTGFIIPDDCLGIRA